MLGQFAGPKINLEETKAQAMDGDIGSHVKLKLMPKTLTIGQFDRLPDWGRNTQNSLMLSDFPGYLHSSEKGSVLHCSSTVGRVFHAQSRFSATWLRNFVDEAISAILSR